MGHWSEKLFLSVGFQHQKPAPCQMRDHYIVIFLLLLKCGSIAYSTCLLATIILNRQYLSIIFHGRANSPFKGMLGFSPAHAITTAAKNTRKQCFCVYSLENNYPCGFSQLLSQSSKYTILSVRGSSVREPLKYR